MFALIGSAIVTFLQLTFGNHIAVDEAVKYTPHPEDPSKTLLTQEAVVTVRGVPLTNYMEDLLASKISFNASKVSNFFLSDIYIIFFYTLSFLRYPKNFKKMLMYNNPIVRVLFSKLFLVLLSGSINWCIVNVQFQVN